ncbi:hypothetical protein ACP_1644 [Acidobacterium capsulatum ATCC 51196]|uniref:Uncharacterized protein n=1 Tax=Acidobacterium capsulatum (strain ATCC 51196 / DSM 11244 / BCRC 80197 / JCM 7670 / NBRC 15755 / NCIMB 13165 / 161) TaxID=240015 RepID=C1F789_ACIC5|nr:hypothetical protein ACP_1644 [Acidobacterium capsulatum ATCC 51196]
MAGEPAALQGKHAAAACSGTDSAPAARLLGYSGRGGYAHACSCQKVNGNKKSPTL